MCAQGGVANTQVRRHAASAHRICYLNCCLLPDPIPARKKETVCLSWAEGLGKEEQTWEAVLVK